MGEEKISQYIIQPLTRETVAEVVKVCLKTPEVGEIIVVNDGSQDKTKEGSVFRDKNKVKVVNLPKTAARVAVAQGLGQRVMITSF